MSCTSLDSVALAVRELLGSATLHAYHQQVLRVQRWLSARDPERDPTDVVGLFRKNRLLSGLDELVSGPFPSAEAASLAFAACAFPRQGYSPLEVDERSSLFVETYRALEASNPVDVLGRAFGTDAKNLLAVATSVTAADDVELNATEAEERRTAGLLYLSTRTPADWVTIESFHGPTRYKLRGSVVSVHQGKLLGFLRRNDSRPSTSVARKSDYPDWNAVCVQLQRDLEAKDDELYYCEILTRLEQKSYKYAQNHTPLSSADEIDAAVDKFWPWLLAKLHSGLPYFGFEAQLPTWWDRQLPDMWPKIERKVKKVPIDEDPRRVVLVARDAPRDDESFLSYRNIREAFLHVRGTWGADGPDELDGRWRELLEEMTTTEFEGERGATHHAKRNDAKKTRLKKRVAAALAGRAGRPPESTYFENGATTTCHVLGGLVPPKRALLWAFSAHHFFVKRHCWDVACFNAYLRELWLWLQDPEFETSLSANGRCALDEALLETLSGRAHPELHELLQTLRDTAESDVDGLLEDPSKRKLIRDGGRDATHLLRDALGDFGVASLRSNYPQQTLPGHLGLAIWYLAAVERLDRQAILARLWFVTDRAPRAVAAELRRWEGLNTSDSKSEESRQRRVRKLRKIYQRLDVSPQAVESYLDALLEHLTRKTP